MKLITIAFAVLSIVLFQSKSQATPLQYGIIGTICKTSNPNSASVKVDDQVYLYFEIEPGTDPYIQLSDHNGLYSPSPVVRVDIDFYRGNTFYHHASNDPKINPDELGLMMILQLGGPAQIWHYLYQPLVSAASVPHSTWRADYLHLDIRTLLNNPLYSSLPVDFRLADGNIEEFTVDFKDDENSILRVEILPTRIIFDNPHSL